MACLTWWQPKLPHVPTKRCAVFAPYLLFGGKVGASGVVLAVCACAKGNSDIFTVKLKDWTQSVQSCNSLWVLHDHSTWFEKKFLCHTWSSEREIVAGVHFGSFAMVGLKIREVLQHQSYWCQHVNGAIALVRCQSCWSLMVAILP